MITRDELVDYLDGYLESERGVDYCPNGLQVEGRPEIKKIAAGVSLSANLIERARALGADSLLVHHGLLWNGLVPRVRGSFKLRLAPLLAHDMNLLAYHLPLDRHLEVGTAATVARLLGWSEIEPFGSHHGVPTGVRAEVGGASPRELAAALERHLGRRPLMFEGRGLSIQRAAIVTGDAFGEFQRAVDEGLDLFVTGEPKERAMDLAREEGVHFIAAGHYHTEAPGVRALAQHIAERFPVEVEFIDLPNPV